VRAPRVRKARHVVRWFLKAAGRYAVCLPPRGIYVLPGRAGEPGLLQHELVHWQQARRMGVIKFYAVYLWYTLRYGYWNNPLEREARENGLADQQN